MNPFFHTGFSISDSLKFVRKSVLNYETIILESSSVLTTITGNTETLFRNMQVIEQGASEQSKDAIDVSRMTDSLQNSFMELKDRSDKMKEAAENSKKIGVTGSTCIENLQTQTNLTLENINGTSEAISTLSEKSDNIKSILKTINSISQQTMILSLNASIEASRAGESGKGFAVVAKEIRSLADSSSEATANIAQIIGEISENITGAVNSVDEIQKEFSDQIGAVKEAYESFSGIRAVSDSISEFIGQAYELVAEMQELSSRITEHISDITEISSKTADGAKLANDSLSEQKKLVLNFSEEIDKLAKTSRQLSEQMSKFKVQ